MSAYRHVAGFGLSASVHVLAGGAAIWFGAPERAPIASATSIRAFIVAPTEDAEFLGLNPIDRTPIDGMVGDASEAAAFTVGDLRVEFARVLQHPTLLFPFLTPGVALEHFGVPPERSVFERLRDVRESTRLRILSKIIDTTPSRYRAGDAAYLLGTILWRQGRHSDAFKVCEGIHAERTDKYVRAYSEILDAVRDASVVRTDSSQSIARRIRQILEGERGRWIDASYERLRRFGYHFNTF